MKWAKWLENWDMTSLKVNLQFLEMEWSPQDADRDAAWDLYVELLTRAATQYLAPEHGDEGAALSSLHDIFGLTRAIMARHGRDCMAFAQLAIVVLNQIVRPFTTKWHRLSIDGGFSDSALCAQFRSELSDLQNQLRKYTMMLADMAGVEDLTNLQSAP